MDLFKDPGVVYVEFAKNTYIIRQGEKIDFVYYLASGSCYRKMITEKGDEVIYGIKQASDNFIQSLLGVLILYSDGISMHNFCAISKCCCYKIPKDIFFRYVSDKPEILTQLIYMAMRELRALASSFQARQEGKVANQLCSFLLRNAQLKHDNSLISRGYSNLEISQLLGVHKVTVARILRVLKEEGIVGKNKEGIVILNRKELEVYAAGGKNIDY